MRISDWSSDVCSSDLPLMDSPNVHSANALQTDWTDILDPANCSYILGNPPFIGAKNLNDGQKGDVAPIYSTISSGGGLLDYVAAWYIDRKSTRLNSSH